MLIVGIDPGFGGAIARFDTSAPDYSLEVWDMPVHVLRRGGKVKRDVDPYALVAILRDQKVDHCFIELVNAMPGQGVSSVFAFGKAYGMAICAVACVGIPLTLVPPKTWKKALTVPAAKDGARARASQLLPGGADRWQLVKHDGRAEAALIALYGARSLNETRAAA